MVNWLGKPASAKSPCQADMVSADLDLEEALDPGESAEPREDTLLGEAGIRCTAV